MALGDLHVARMGPNSDLRPASGAYWLVQEIKARVINNGASLQLRRGARSIQLMGRNSRTQYSIGAYYLLTQEVYLHLVGTASSHLTFSDGDSALITYEEVQLGSGVGQRIVGGLDATDYTLRPAAGQEWRITASVGNALQTIQSTPSEYAVPIVGSLVVRDHPVTASATGYIAAIRTA